MSYGGTGRPVEKQKNSDITEKLGPESRALVMWPGWSGKPKSLSWWA